MKCMINFKSLLKEKSTAANFLFSSAFAYGFCFWVYKILYPLCTYKNLRDFYVGTTIYENHSKYLDIGMFFVYLILFYLIFCFNKIKFPKFRINISKYKKYLNLFLSLIIGILGMYILLQPHGIWFLDSHHYGEKFAVYWAHIKYGMKYYSDIMLVHGFQDVIPAWIADNIMGELTFTNERIACGLINLMFCVVNLTMSFVIFKKDKVFALLSSGILFIILNLKAASSIHCITFALAYLILLQFYNRNSFLWYGFFYLSSAFMLLYQTTVGTACFLGMLPLLVRKFRDNYKNGIIFCILSIATSYFLFGDLIFAYFGKAGYYITSNLYAFGNDFPSKINLFIFTTSIFGFLAVPFFINSALKTDNKKILYLSLYSIIVPIAILNYALGRIDASCEVPRACWLSWIIFAVILPYYSYLENKHKYLVKVILCILFITSARLNFPAHTEFYEDIPVTRFLQTAKAGDYLDLTNKGMNYFYSGRKPSIPYTSYYNIVNTKQTKEILAELEKNPPAVVLVNTNNRTIVHDGVKPPQRINAIYKWLYSSGLYKEFRTKQAVFLVHSSAKGTFSDDIATNDLQYLPDAWGASVNTLPMKKVYSETKINGNEIFVSVPPKSADLLYVEFSSIKPVELKMTLNNSNSALKFKSKQNALLLPLDNFPSWLNEEMINRIKFNSDKEIKITKAELYKRN